MDSNSFVSSLPCDRLKVCLNLHILVKHLFTIATHVHESEPVVCQGSKQLLWWDWMKVPQRALKVWNPNQENILLINSGYLLLSVSYFHNWYICCICNYIYFFLLPCLSCSLTAFMLNIIVLCLFCALYGITVEVSYICISFLWHLVSWNNRSYKC